MQFIEATINAPDWYAYELSVHSLIDRTTQGYVILSAYGSGLTVGKG